MKVQLHTAILYQKNNISRGHLTFLKRIKQLPLTVTFIQVHVN